MVPTAITRQLSRYLSQELDQDVHIIKTAPLSGGCIHHATRVETNAGPYFLKWNDSGEAENFQAEFRGLKLLADHAPALIARPLQSGLAGHHSYLVLEYIEPGGRSGDYWEHFGRQLAALHKNTNPRYPGFGLDHDNFIGSLPQSNKKHRDWAAFFAGERLRPQWELALSQGLVDTGLVSKLEKICTRLPELIPEEPPALLHGDLWSGNVLCDQTGHVKLVDPAVYYGHREAEIAFTLLFGGFSESFYQAYQESYHLQPGWRERVDLFNLYPLLVHVNLFGRSYLYDVERIAKVF